MQLASGGCGFKSFSPYFEAFNERIGHSISFGHAKKLNELLSPPSRTKFDDIDPQVLTMEHLGLSFVACLIPLGVSIAVFLVELVVHKLTIKWKKPLVPLNDRLGQHLKLNRYAVSFRKKQKSNRISDKKNQSMSRNQLQQNIRLKICSSSAYKKR